MIVIRQHLLSIALLFWVGNVFSQSQRLPDLDSVGILLTDMSIQIECTSGVDDMYNFKFDRAESQFQYIKRKYPEHPLPYFLMGLSHWWKIMPNVDNEKWDEPFLAYMDTSIYLADQLFEENEENIEAAFFLAAAHAFKGRLYSERGSWTKAALAGKRALKFMDYSRNKEDLSPELLFGDGLYNYYSVWIPENYPILKPFLIFFEKGDKALGIEQLQTVTKEAFYTRVEAQFFLMRIYAIEEKKPQKALQIVEYLHQTYPDNPYFQRFYARMLYTVGDYNRLETTCKDILKKIENGMPGYEEISGRYASFFLASVYKLRHQNIVEANNCYRKVVDFAEKIEAFKSGYYLYSLSTLGQQAKREEKYEEAKAYFDKILEHADKKNAAYKEAKAFKKEYKRYQRSRN